MAVRAGDALTAALCDDIDRLLTAEPEVRRDAADSVHQMRVATRRLRSILRSYTGLLDPGATNEVRTELAWLAGVLGVARDAEVRADRFATLLQTYAGPTPGTDASAPDTVDAGTTDTARPSAAAASTSTGNASGVSSPALRRTHSAGDDVPGPGTTVTGAAIASATRRLVDAERDRYSAAHDAVLSALGSYRYLALRERLSSWRTDPPLRESDADEPATEFFAAVLRKDRRRVAGLVRDEITVAAADRIELLHDIRKSAKRLRYSCEAAFPVLGDHAAALGNQAKLLQTVLGDHRDAVESHTAIVARAAEAHAAGEDTSLFRVLADAEEAAAGRFLAGYPAAAAALEPC